MRQRTLPLALTLAGLTLGLFVVAFALAADGTASQSAAAARPGLPHQAYLPGLARDEGVQPTPTPPAESFEIIFLDVGQGDATLITVNGERLLIDAGRSGSTIRQRLQARGITDLDAILATHPDADHIGGFIEVLAMYQIERIYLNGGDGDSQTYASFMAAVNAEGAQVRTLRRGDTVPLGGLRLPVLHPAALTGDSNIDSLVVRLTCGSVDVLLTGDAEAPSEGSMLAAGVVTDVEVLKVGHHGSRTSSSQAFLNAAKPEVAVISAGRTNQYGHPHQEVLSRLAGVGASVLYTDTTEGDDSVVMTSDCSTYSFSAQSGSPGVPAATPTASPRATSTPTQAGMPTPTRSATPTRTATPGAVPDAWYTSAASNAQYYYCSLDPQWKQLSPANLRKYPTEAALLAEWGGRRVKHPDSKC